jgi:hypothetical protein
LGEAGRPVIFPVHAWMCGSHPAVRRWGLQGGQGKGAALVVKGDMSRAGGAARLMAGGFAPLSWSGDGVRAARWKGKSRAGGEQRPCGGERGTEGCLTYGVHPSAARGEGEGTRGAGEKRSGAAREGWRRWEGERGIGARDRAAPLVGGTKERGEASGARLCAELGRSACPHAGAHACAVLGHRSGRRVRGLGRSY